MRSLGTNVRALTLEAINSALNNAQVGRVPEFVIIEATFVAADTSTSFAHSLGKKPTFAFWLGKTASVVYAADTERSTWNNTSITLKCDAIDSGILVIGVL